MYMSQEEIYEESIKYNKYLNLLDAIEKCKGVQRQILFSDLAEIKKQLRQEGEVCIH